MAPKKVMKAMKKKQQTLMKGPKPKSQSSSSKKKPGKEKAALLKGMTSKLTKSQLDKLGKLSLKEKVEHATASAETAEEAAENLKEIIKPNERGQIWSKHQITMRGDKDAQDEHNALNKTQKGLASLLWFVENQSKKFCHSSASIGTKHTLIKGDTWKTEKQMIDQFGADELHLHIQSGRIQWRNDPYTPDVYQYKDLGDITGSTEVTRKRQHTMGVDLAATGDHEDHFRKEWGKGGHHMLHDAEAAGKGQRASGSKGSKGGRGGKGNRAPLAITNGDEKDTEKDGQQDDEKEWNKCLVKAQKAKEGCILAISNMEEAISNCQKAGRLTKAARKDYEDLMKDVHGQAEKLKKLLKLKGNHYTMEAAKEIIVGAANKTKELKDETKECVGLANKAGSKASTKR